MCTENLKILLSKKRKIKKFKNSTVEVVLFDPKNYKVAVRTIEGYTGLVDNRLDWYTHGLYSKKITSQQIADKYWTIYQLSPIK